MAFKLKKTLLSQAWNPWSYPLVGFILLSSLIMSAAGWTNERYFSILSASREQVLQQHQFYRLFTTIFMHADIRHFLSNALFFFIFGFLLHSYFGILWFPLLSFFFGALVNFSTLALYPAQSTLIGASGVVYLMVGAWATLYFFIERGQKPIKRFMAALGVSLILLFPTEYEPSISYLSHGLGFGYGVFVATVYFLFNRNRLRTAEVWVETIPDLELESLSEQYQTELRFQSTVLLRGHRLADR